MNKRLRVVCPAKINLTLEVMGQRPDGYHELRTIFQGVSLADGLTLTREAEAQPLAVSGIPVPVTGNLCLAAVEAYGRRRPVPGDVALHLHKRIPVGAGLGGGSSDAAGVLVGLDHWLGPADSGALEGMAAELGSDVAFFLQGGTALGAGRGEELSLLPGLPPTWLVLARSDLHVSTREAYGALRPEDYTAGEHTAALAVQLGPGCGLRQLAGHLYNAFERPVVALFPEIAAVKEQLLQAGAEAVLLAGSGAAVFGLFAGERSATEAAAALRERGTWAAAAVTIPDGVRVGEPG